MLGRRRNRCRKYEFGWCKSCVYDSYFCFQFFFLLFWKFPFSITVANATLMNVEQILPGVRWYSKVFSIVTKDRKKYTKLIEGVENAWPCLKILELKFSHIDFLHSPSSKSKSASLSSLQMLAVLTFSDTSMLIALDCTSIVSPSDNGSSSAMIRKHGINLWRTFASNIVNR